MAAARAGLRQRVVVITAMDVSIIGSTRLTAADISPHLSRIFIPLIVGICSLDKFFNIFRRKTF